MKTLLAMLVALVVGAGVVWIVMQPKAEPTFHVRTITSAADVKACIAVHGYAAQLAQIDPDGQLASDWKPACLVEVK